MTIGEIPVLERGRQHGQESSQRMRQQCQRVRKVEGAG